MGFVCEERDAKAERSHGHSPLPRIACFADYLALTRKPACVLQRRTCVGVIGSIMPAKKSIKILLAIKRPLIRLGLVRLVSESLPRAKVISVDNGSEAMRSIVSMNPDVVVAEPEIVVEEGFELPNESPDYRLLLISPRQHVGVEYIPGLELACAHLCDGASEAVLIDAIQRVSDCSYPSSEDCQASDCPLRKTLLPMATGLSRRQEQVFILISEGLQPKDIAERLKISVKTVESYRDQIKQKLELPDARSVFEFGVLWRRGYGGLPEPDEGSANESQLSAKTEAGKGRSKK
ncbi:response regulator transcription factor [Pseudomarimonas arenosa]|uniref:Response regulator transcription factor n=1 Tax=Pseudomarimonas arenosa TaxID=2774145 RepID=A0AAW3ZJN1_9GAMM|nr:response regulator transcription factor [Pseudomarimonas arenosa]MBD8526290.1 response regulator transcription factor [Pseudomarimonas arenosa]